MKKIQNGLLAFLAILCMVCAIYTALHVDDSPEPILALILVSGRFGLMAIAIVAVMILRGRLDAALSGAARN